MAHSRRPKFGKNIVVIIISAIFGLVGTVCLIIGFHNEIVSWLKEFGIAMMVIAFPIMLFMIYTIGKRKIEGM